MWEFPSILFPSILTGCLGPSGELWPLLRCGPDVSAWVWKTSLEQAPWSKWAGVSAAGSSSELGRGRSARWTLYVEGREKQEQAKRARGFFWRMGSIPRSQVGVSEPSTTHCHLPNCPMFQAAHRFSYLFVFGPLPSLPVCTDPLFFIIDTALFLCPLNLFTCVPFHET